MKKQEFRQYIENMANEAALEVAPWLSEVATKLGISASDVQDQLPADPRELYKPKNAHLPIAKAFREAMATHEPDLAAKYANL